MVRGAITEGQRGRRARLAGVTDGEQDERAHTLGRGGSATRHPAGERRRRERHGEPPVVGLRGGRLPRRARRVPGGRPLRVVPGGALRGRRGPARRRRRPPGPRGRQRRGPVRPVALGPGRGPGGARPLAGDAPPRAADRARCRARRTARAGRRGPVAVRGGGVRPGLLGVRRAAVRRRLGRGDERGGPGAAAGRAVGVRGDPSGAVVVPGRPGPRRAGGARLLLRPAALRRAGRPGRRDLRRAPPDAGRPGA